MRESISRKKHMSWHNKKLKGTPLIAKTVFLLSRCSHGQLLRDIPRAETIHLVIPSADSTLEYKYTFIHINNLYFSNSLFTLYVTNPNKTISNYI